MFCQNCGKQLPDNAKFCGYCGASQNGDPGRTPQPEQREMQSEKQREMQSGKRQGPAKKKMPGFLKVFIGLICAAAVIVLVIYGMYWNEFYRVPEKNWKEAWKTYESGDYYQAYLKFFSSDTISRAKYRKYRDDEERYIASLLKYCDTLKVGDVFKDYHGNEWHVLERWEESDKMVLGINSPTYETEESSIAYPNYYDFPMWDYYEAGLIPVDGKPVAAMTDELAVDTFGTTAAQEAKTRYQEECRANPDAQWFYPMVILDLSFPKEDPFWESVLYGARLNTETQEFIYGPLQMTISSKTDIPQVQYQHLAEDYTEQTAEAVVADFEAAGGINVAVNYLETKLQEDGETMVETLLVDYDLSDGSAQSTCRFRCWNIHDPKSILEIRWVVSDSESYRKAVEIMDTMKLAEKPVTEFEGYCYVGYRTHVRELDRYWGEEEYDNSPISHTYENMWIIGRY